MQSTTNDAADRERLWELIKDIKFAMFTTRHGNGHLHSRPMTTQNGKIDEDTSLWFFMSRSSEAVQDLTAQPNVNVVYADTGKDDYVSIAGEARVVEDMGKKKQLWNRMTEAWFPNGPEDPDVALVQVSITHADYWASKDNKVTQLLKMAVSSVTGKPPTDMSEHAKLNMK